ncbi:MAG TPA: gliding motility-associated C-terminal domain-containing protein, partial [Chitinophagales bacterium]|nr:gliding motility-associated C-terminal domain-containing protein [Chitinophagales bacterium]
VDLAVSGGTPPYQFAWSDSSTQEDLTLVAAGYYAVTVTDASGCTALASADVSNTAVGSLTLNGLVDTLCSGESFTVSASGMSTYTWSPANGLSNTSGDAVTVNALVDMAVTVTAADQNGCLDSATFNVVALPRAMATPGGPYAGCAPLDVQLSSEWDGAVGVEWWIGGVLVSTDPNPVLPFDAGTYDVTLVAVSPFGCNDTSTFSSLVMAVGPPSAGFTVEAMPGVDDEPARQFAFNAYGANGNTYLWAFGDGTTDTAFAVQHTYAQAGEYTVTLVVQNEAGCVDTASRTLEVDPSLDVFIPNTFTPNNDGANDVFRVYGKDVRSYTMRVYDRWGTKVFESLRGLPEWDGVFQNLPLNTGVYVYVVTVHFANDAVKEMRGDVTLLR